MKATLILLILQFFYIFLLIKSCEIQKNPVSKDKDWWETAQFYQIYPRSFKDSDGDGIGDLNGITQNLQYLKDIGITATWLSPIFKSPMKDFGYDISDFYDIQPEYGTMKDFENLLKKAHELGIKIILDFVPNHTSDKNEWFIKSENRVKSYENFFVWHDGKIDPKNSSNRLPPNNWLQAFRGSAWQWSEKRKQFYLHQFTVQQPDLNYRNPVVVEQMKHVLWFWLDKGVDGFRIDAVPNLFEIAPDENGDYPDEPISGLTNDTDNFDYLKHIYTQDQPETIDMVYQWRKFLDDYQRIHGGDSRVLLTETYSSVKVVKKYYGDGQRNGAHIPFNFNFIMHTNINSTAKDFNDVINLWLNTMPPTSTPNWVMGNHDQNRAGSRYGKERIDIMNMLIMMLPGVSVTYNGEEIGMIDGNLTWAESVDPAACNSNPNIYQKFSRDPERTPFQWDNSTNAGFSNASKTWLPVNPDYKDINVKTELEQSNSHLKVFKELVKLRKSPVLRYGDFAHGLLGNDVLVIRRWSGQINLFDFTLVANFVNSTQNIDLKKFYPAVSTEMVCDIVSVTSKRMKNDKVTTSNFTLDPFEAIIISTIGTG